MLVPKLRFKREDGTDYPEWEEKRLSDLLTISKERNNKAEYTQNDVLACSLGTELGKKYLYFGLKATKESVKNYRVVRIGDIVYTKSPIKGFPNGIIRANKRTEGIVPSLYCVYHNESEVRSDIIQTYFDTGNNVNNFLNKLVNVGARNNVNITDIGLLEGTIIVPVNSEEQQKIADFLSVVDEVIAQSEAEVQNLEQQKKAAMQKIFSQEVRFKREDGTEYPKWEEKRVGEICSVSTGKSNTQDKIDNGQYPFYVRSPIIEHSDKYLYDEEAVITVGDGVGTGKVYHYVNGKYNLHQRCYRMYDFVNITAKYFFYVFSSHFYKRIKSMSAKTSVDSVRMDMITDMKILLPCLEEQQKIADFLSAYDEAISYAKQELDKWKELKKGLLQQMFV